jgi:2-dehydropantoate 2-reductase
VAVVGAGSVGGVFAAHLSTVNDVVACVRRPFDRWIIESPELPYEGPAVAVTDPADLAWDGPADAVLVALKAQHTDGAAGWFPPLCGPDTIVVSVQNGIEGVERLAPLAPQSTVLPGVVYCGAELVAPGHVRHSALARLIVPDEPAGHRLAELAAGTGLRIEASAGHREAAWVKLGLNSVANGLTALTGKPMEVVADPGVRAIGEQLLTECWTIGRAAGADLDLDAVPRTLEGMGRNVGGRTSMLQDREAGRPTEHDAIHGAILRAGRRHDIPTPVTRIVHDLLAAGNPGDDEQAG